jgi:hypothetical protein
MSEDNSAMRAIGVVFTLLLIELFVGALINAGYSVATALAAASAVGMLAVEINGRLGGPGSPVPPGIDS